MAKERTKKVTMILPEDLLQRAMRVSKSGMTPTVKEGLKLLADRDIYARLLKMQGKGGFSMSWQELRGEE